MPPAAVGPVALAGLKVSLCPPTQLTRHRDRNRPLAQVAIRASAFTLQVAAYVGQF